MGIEVKKSNRVLTEKEFLRRMYAAIKTFKPIENEFKRRTNALALEFIKKNCKYTVGQDIWLWVNDKGYNHFKIELIAPEINWKEAKVRFKASGVFSDDTGRTETGTLYLDEVKGKDDITKTDVQ